MMGNLLYKSDAISTGYRCNASLSRQMYNVPY